MAIAQSLLSEFDYEMGTTRKMLERFPEDKAEWRPHDTCMTLGRLTGHVAEIPGWTVPTIAQDNLVLDSNFVPKTAKSRDEVVKFFDETAASARAAIAGAQDDVFMKPWSLIVNGQAVMTLPKIAVMRSFVMNHMIHHRGQLAAFYRIAGVKIPSLYGPSKDEAPF
jgi:uncharacterized damage-inducible protein DinB